MEAESCRHRNIEMMMQHTLRSFLFGPTADDIGVQLPTVTVVFQSGYDDTHNI